MMISIKKQMLEIKKRLDVLEAQQSVMAGFISVLLQNDMREFPDQARKEMVRIYESLFEYSISSLLGSDANFPDVSFQAVEDMKKVILGPIQSKKY